jgi:hypothetical protein
MCCCCMGPLCKNQSTAATSFGSSVQKSLYALPLAHVLGLEMDGTTKANAATQFTAQSCCCPCLGATRAPFHVWYFTHKMGSADMCCTPSVAPKSDSKINIVESKNHTVTIRGLSNPWMDEVGTAGVALQYDTL